MIRDHWINKPIRGLRPRLWASVNNFANSKSTFYKESACFRRVRVYVFGHVETILVGFLSL